ncbi:MAG: formylglycine-generating enzyme family protein [Myxococcales bacterium]|nr:formylglycine-generating enzyme family protein [Myxococcales bacterium]
MQQVQPEFSFDHGSNSWEGCGLTGTSPWPERARYRCCGGRTGDWSTAHDSDHTSTGSNSSPTFVALQGATFTIGGNCPSPDQPTFRAPEATVRLPGFRISKDEVSQAQYAALTPAFEPEGNPLLPVRQVTWFDAVAYCEKLHEKLTGSASGCVRSDGKAGYDPQQCKVDTVYRLPTEAEWEYAAGGAEQAPQDLGTTAVYSTDGPLEPGSRSPNDLGVRHMLGNVSEWTLDVYFSNRTPHAVLDSPMFVSRDPHAVRVVKGGSFHNASEWLRSCGRHGMAPSTRTDFRGFRCVKGPARPEQDLLYK